MSLPMAFTFYDKDGNILFDDVRICSATTLDQLGNLNYIHKNLFEHINHPMVIWRKEIAFVAPTHLMYYMFDCKDGSLLPNRFYKASKK